MNFGTIKDIYAKFLINSYLTEGKVKKHKNLYKNFIKTISENEILRTEFIVYKNIENGYFPSESSAIEYLKENISLFDKYRKEDIKKVNENLAQKLIVNTKGYTVPGTKHPADICLIKSKNIHEALDTLITLEKKAETINTLHESFEFVKKWLTTPKNVLNENYKPGDKIVVNRIPEEKPYDRIPRGYEDIKIGDVLTITKVWDNANHKVYGTDFVNDYGISDSDIKNLTGKNLRENKKIDPNKFLDIAVEKYNEKYSTLGEEEKKVLKTIMSSNKNEKESLLKDMIKESITLINNALEEYGGNIDVKSKLLGAKDLLYNMEFNESTYGEDISKIYDLKQSLS